MLVVEKKSEKKKRGEGRQAYRSGYQVFKSKACKTSELQAGVFPRCRPELYVIAAENGCGGVGGVLQWSSGPSGPSGSPGSADKGEPTSSRHGCWSRGAKGGRGERKSRENRGREGAGEPGLSEPVPDAACSLCGVSWIGVR